MNNAIKNWAKDFYTSPRKIYRWPISTPKDAPYHMSFREVLMKTTVRYHYTLSKWQRCETLTAPNAGEDMQQQEFSFITGGNTKY